MEATTVKAIRTFNAEEAIVKGTLVKLGTAAGQILMADAADYPAAIGVAEEAIAINTEGAVKLINAGGTFRCKAHAAITIHQEIELGADGEVDPPTGGATDKIIGYALEAASADLAIIECILFQTVHITDNS